MTQKPRYIPRVLLPATLAAVAACSATAEQAAPVIAAQTATAAPGADMAAASTNPNARLLSGISSVGPNDKPEDVAQREGLQVRFFDLNHDGKPDVYRFFRVQADPSNAEVQLEILVRKEVDINQDGRFDMVRLYGPNQVITEERDDLDFDGKIDELSYYQDGTLSRKELDLDFDGKPDVVKYYAQGHLVRIESDRRHSGKIDTWEYYENDSLDRIGMDTNGDGTVDVWQRQTKGPPAAKPVTQ